jgi:hypothetical protein
LGIFRLSSILKYAVCPICFGFFSHLEPLLLLVLSCMFYVSFKLCLLCNLGLRQLVPFYRYCSRFRELTLSRYIAFANVYSYAGQIRPHRRDKQWLHHRRRWNVAMPRLRIQRLRIGMPVNRVARTRSWVDLLNFNARHGGCRDERTVVCGV